MTQDGPEPDLASERGVLAGLCKFGEEAWADVGDLLRVESFTLDSNQVLWKCLEYAFGTMRTKKIDVPTIYSAARSLGLSDFLQDPEEKRHLQAVLKYPIELSSLRQLARKVRKLDVARELIAKTYDIQNGLREVTGDESIDRLISLAEEPIHGLTSLLSKGFDSIGAVRLAEGAEEYFQNKMDNPVEELGISTGFPRYDRAIGGGLRRRAIDMIVARQKTGKSILGVNVALHVAVKLGVPVLYADSELEREEQLERAAACLAGIDTHLVESGRVPQNLRKRLLDAAGQLRESPLDYECVGGLAPEDILSRLRRWVIRTVGFDETGRTNPCLIVYDWFKLMDPSMLTRSMGEHQLLGHLIDSLKHFVRQYQVPCLMFGQQNRDGVEKKDTTTVRGSDRVIDTVSSFTIFRWKDEGGTEAGERPAAAKYTHELIPVVCRHGPGMRRDDYINVETDYRRAFVAEGPTRNELFSQNGGKLKGLSYDPVQSQPQSRQQESGE